MKTPLDLRLPSFARPLRAEPRTIVTGAALLATIVVTATYFWPVAHAVVPPASFLVVVMVRFAIRQASVPRIVAACILGGPIAGWLTGAIGGGLHTLELQTPLAALIIGWLLSAPFGFAYGLGIMPLLVATRRLRLARSSDAGDRAARIAGLWLVTAAIFLFCLHHAQLLPFFVRGHFTLDEPPLSPVDGRLGGTLLLVVGMLLAGASTARLRRQKRWLLDVIHGRIEEWQAANAVSNGCEESALPWLTSRNNGDSVVVLSCRQAIAGSAYRETYLPVARASAPLQRAKR